MPAPKLRIEILLARRKLAKIRNPKTGRFGWLTVQGAEQLHQASQSAEAGGMAGARLLKK